jgi:hypothetical protein
MRRPRRIAAIFSAVALVAAFAVACTPPTNPPINSGVIARQTPLTGTPQFSGPTNPQGFGTSVESIAQVGNFMLAGGSFTQVNGSAQSFLAAWGAPNGAVSDAIPPTNVNGEVLAIEATPGRSGAYVAGKFTKAIASNAPSGVLTSIAVYNLLTKQVNPNFKVTVDGTINTMQLVGSHLLIGGYFAHVNGQLRFGLASVNATTGAVDNYLQIRLSGHHNFGTNGGAVEGQVGVISMAVAPDGSRMVVLGNFITAYNDEFAKTTAYARDQILRVNLGNTATIDPSWATLAFHQTCNKNAFDSYVSQVAYSPDGSFFVVVDAGGYTHDSHQLCDSASRFNASSSGSNVAPVWGQWTGTDSLYSVAVTSAAVYIGGHQRWLNNPAGQDNARAGAVARPGIAALDPVNGAPLSWNPGRSPRGHGTAVIYGTKDGVWFGSDTNCIGPGAGNSCVGPNTFPLQELAYFPYQGGTVPPQNVIGNGTRIVKLGTTVTQNAFNPATGAGGPTTNPNSGGIDWSHTRGAFALDGNVYYGKDDGNFYFRTFRGGVWGSEILIDPYDDPTWDNVLTGSPTGSTNTYQGVKPSFYTNMSRVTAMFYSNRFIYYTLIGDPQLYRVGFAPGTQPSSVNGHWTGGVVYSVPQIVVRTGGIQSFANVGGMFLAGGRLWIASRTSGALYSMGWNGSTITSASVRDVNAAGTWNGLGVFVAQ